MTIKLKITVEKTKFKDQEGIDFPTINKVKKPKNDKIIDQVNCLANQNRMLRGLKILTHNNTTLYDSTLIAGVDNQDIQENKDNQDDQNNK